MAGPKGIVACKLEPLISKGNAKIDPIILAKVIVVKRVSQPLIAPNTASNLRSPCPIASILRQIL
jgi:hypothetical protein